MGPRILHKQFQLPVPSQSQETIENIDTFFMFPKIN